MRRGGREKKFPTPAPEVTLLDFAAHFFLMPSLSHSIAGRFIYCRRAKTTPSPIRERESVRAIERGETNRKAAK